MRLKSDLNLPIPDKMEFGHKSPKTKNKKSLLRSFFGCLFGLILMIAILLIIVWAMLAFVTGPIIRQVNALPDDFPKQLLIDEINGAKIKLETPQAKEKIISLVNSLPNWLLTPALNYLSESVRSQLIANFGDKLNLPSQVTADDLKDILKSTATAQTQTVTVSWDELGQDKEELSAFFKAILRKENFQVQENLQDYRIDLGFWKEGIFGSLSLKDLIAGSSSQAEMKVNYLAATSTSAE